MLHRYHQMTNDDQPLDSLPLPVAAAALDIAGADEVDGIAEDVAIVVFSREDSVSRPEGELHSRSLAYRTLDNDGHKEDK